MSKNNVKEKLLVSWQALVYARLKEINDFHGLNLGLQINDAEIGKKPSALVFDLRGINIKILDDKNDEYWFICKSPNTLVDELSCNDKIFERLFFKCFDTTIIVGKKKYKLSSFQECLSEQHFAIEKINGIRNVLTIK